MAEMSVLPKRLDSKTSRSCPDFSSTRKHQTKIRILVYHCLIALIGLISVPFVSGAQDSQPSQIGSGEEFTLKMKVNLVILSATVLDRHNTPVSGLDKGDFQVYEDKQLQQIKQFSHDDIPITVGILVDNSGSMGPKRDDVITAALAFARSSNSQDQMFVVNFNDHVSFGLPPGMPFTNRQEELQLALSRIRTIGQTSLYDGIAAALDHLKQGKSDKKVLILISDGGDNASKQNLIQVLGMAKQNTAIIYAIGIFDEQDDDQNPSVLRRLARETGGEAFFPESSKEVVSICEGIARDIRSQYTLAYVPTIAEEDGSYRTVEVRASAHGRGRLSVRTRAGYSVPLAKPVGAAKVIVNDSRN
ncbi:MAG: VWA domain-containing protein [Terracidiphilus sp.]